MEHRQGLKKLNKKDEKERVIQYLMGLNDSSAAIHGQILLMQSLPNIPRVYSPVLQQEKRLKFLLTVGTFPSCYACGLEQQDDSSKLR
ncbi:hypothetical protein Patl1_16279 [Pistacia atlantica]|uniref:Uncharacterized protein n=1 Tax=Pistacia atlantica TaxID=434234 RepID=A0ACC1B9A6_9ROSI|nr:hypothetical protein Patl1_16279 [Pistacia atlantica]